ncbi:MAG: hypothetical protein QOJ69_1994 [Actinomycetota bacterium]|nr:hypothetical protein [Actinomycetota bacterium]
MPTLILDRLRCPDCGQAMAEEEGGVVCGEGHRLPFRSGFLDASNAPVDEDTQRTFRSFGYEWTRFEQMPDQDEVSWQEYFASVPLDELQGRVALDAGCGQGRYTRFTAARVKALVALDGSEAVVAAAAHLSDLPNVEVIKADLRRAPLAPESFGFVSCLGVLHHLSDPEEGFRALVRLLAPGGILLLYLYSRPESGGFRATALAGATALRTVTVRLPHPILRALSAPIALALDALVVLPGRLGEGKGARLARLDRLSRLPLAAYRRRPFKTLWLDTFDRLSAPIETRYVWDDVEPWFRDAGLSVEAVSHTTGLTVVARRSEVPCTSSG